jgi:hypothetical protein
VYYFAGRGGVLGDVDPDVVTAAFGYFSPELVRKVWGPGLAVEGARAASVRYAEACAEWGRSRLQGLEGLDRLAELAERVVDAVPVGGLSLFAGWRAAPRPQDGAGRAFACVHLLRELRGSAHIIATTALGLSPLESILRAPLDGGPERAKTFGWTEPFPETAQATERRTEAETLTDRLVAGYLEVLTPPERAELVALVQRLQSTLDAG